MSADINWQIRGQLRGVEIDVAAPLGSGGQSSVYRGEVLSGPDAGRVVAVKFIGVSGSEARQRDALREVRILADLDSDGVPNFIDAGVFQRGTIWLAMELVEGVNLRDYVSTCGPIQGADAEASLLAILHQLVQVLRELDKHGVLHRDVKPGNVIVNESLGKLWLVDFGMAKGSGDFSATQAGTIKGTPAYLAPEAIMGRFSGASDLYGAAAVTYFCATGKPPHEIGDGGAYWAVARAVLSSKPVPVTKACPGLFSKRFSALLSTAMHPDPEQRPSPEALLTQIEALLAVDDLAQ